jgi:ParB family chromosome partitioning protein
VIRFGQSPGQRLLFALARCLDSVRQARLQDLSPKVKPLLEGRDLDMGHARALLAIEDPVQQYDAARQVVKSGLSVRATERLVKTMLEPKPAAKAAAAGVTGDADIRRLEMDVSERLGARVRLEHSAKGMGRVVISYNSLDELDGILKHIK